MRVFWEQAGRHGATYLAAEVIAKGGVYVLFVWLATLLTVDEFGLLNVFVSLLTMVAVVVGLGLPEGLVRFHFGDSDFRAVLALAITLPLAMALLLFVSIVPWNAPVAGALNVPSGLVVLALGGAPLVALRQGWLAVLRARREAGHYLLLRLLEPLLFLAAIVVLLLTVNRVTYAGTASSYLAAIGGVTIVGFASVASRVGLRWSTQPLTRMLVFSLPLVLHSLAMTGLGLFDQLVLQQILGAEVTGTYAFAYRFGMAMSLVVMGFGAAWAPLVLQRLQAGKGTTLVPLARTGFRLLLVSCIVLAWVVPPIAGLLGGTRYSGALHLIPLVVYAYLWVGVYSLASAYVYFRNRSAALAAASGAAFLANAALNYLTIPMWGATAAAATTVISYMLLNVLVWRGLGAIRSDLPWQEFAFQAVLVAPLILGASLFFG